LPLFAVCPVEIWLFDSLIVIQRELLLSAVSILWKGIESMAKAAAKPKAASKTEIFASLAERTGLTKKQVAEFFDALSAEIEKNIGKKGPRVFVLPNLCKIVAVDRPAKPKRQVRNPSNGEMIWAEAKKASVTVRVRPLKKLKEMV
jgi:nucleoid DNA-binding protein